MPKEELELESKRVNKEFEEAIAQHNKIVEEGQKNIIKYFDRIHDKLFNFNNIIMNKLKVVQVLFIQKTWQIVIERHLSPLKFRMKKKDLNMTEISK